MFRKSSRLALAGVTLLTLLLSACAGAGSSNNQVTAAFILAESPADKGWNAAAMRGIEALKTLGTVTQSEGDSFHVKLKDGRTLNVIVVENAGYDDAQIERVFRGVLDANKPNIVFGTWFNAANTMAKLAKETPKVLFEHDSGYPLVKSSDSPNKNFSTYFIRQEQGDYLVGYLAGLQGYAKIGVVGTIQIPEPMRAVNAFTLGLQRGLKEAGQDPASAQVKVVWLQSWLDVKQEQSASKALIDQGYKVIRQLADTPYASQTACNNSAIALGYGTDVATSAPCALVTNQWNWGAYYLSRVNAVLNNTWAPQDWWGGFASDAVSLVGWNASVPADAKTKVEAVAADIKAGKLNIFCGPIEGVGADADGKASEVLSIPEGKCIGDNGQLTMQFYVKGVDSQLPARPKDGYSLDLIDQASAKVNEVVK
jgi:basic membrane protein A and related proteins